MVRDGYFYGIGMAVVAVVVGWLAGVGWAVIPILLGLFFLWFFRDPERSIPAAPGAIVSPADGTVTHVESVEVGGQRRTRISIFLSVFNVHVNRSPIAGTIEAVEYRRGAFGFANTAVSAERNEQNVVTVCGEGQVLVFKQIAGILARRIVFDKKVGDQVERGERVGLIKFGSRMDVILGAEAVVQVKIGSRVHGGASVLAQMPVSRQSLAAPSAGDLVPNR
jgi:phosphatidylserine decarboxylase